MFFVRGMVAKFTGRSVKKMQNFIEKKNIVELNVMNVKKHFEKNVIINLLESVSFAVDLELVLMF